MIFKYEMGLQCKIIIIFLLVFFMLVFVEKEINKNVVHVNKVNFLKIDTVTATPTLMNL